MNSFLQLGLSEPIVQVLQKMGFETPTPIQSQAIPLLLTKDPTDFIGLAQTGTGKTAAFGLPLIDLIDHEETTTQAIVLSPTRELCQQTTNQLVQFAGFSRSLNIVPVYGGANIVPQLKALKSPTQIVVSTRGRLIDLINRKAIKLHEVKYVILDEADEMLNMGFQEDIDTILSTTPDHRAIWLFSATMPKEIRQIIKNYMEQPVEVSVNSTEKSNKDITHQFVVTRSSDKLAAVRRFLDIQPEMRGILFCRTKRETQEIADQLSSMGYGVEALHGDLSQAQRDSAMKRFKARSMQLLIATDVAARGIDVQELTHVIHHTLPDQLEAYTHRSGRTGRAGKRGISLAFINGRERNKILELEKRLNVSFQLIEVPTISDMKLSRIQHWAGIIQNTKVHADTEQIYPSIADQFMNLSKEELIKRWISTQLDHLIGNENEAADLNEPLPGTRQKQNNEDSDINRYFINLGSMDGLTASDLVHILSDFSDVDRKYFTRITVQKNHSFFTVTDGKDKRLTLKFEGIEIDGRPIRVNRDDQKSDRRADRSVRFAKKDSFKKKPVKKAKSGRKRY